MGRQAATLITPEQGLLVEVTISSSLYKSKRKFLVIMLKSTTEYLYICILVNVSYQCRNDLDQFNLLLYDSQKLLA